MGIDRRWASSGVELRRYVERDVDVVVARCGIVKL